MLWNKYKDKIRAAHQDEPQFGAQSTPLDERTERWILALVFAANIDHFMERSYLNALGDALKIPQDVREGIERDLEQQKRTLAE